VKLSIFHKWLVYGVLALVFNTGIFHYLSESAGFPSFGERAASYEWEHLLLSAHGVGAMLYLLVLGSLFPVHIKKSWHVGRNLWSGSLLLALNAVLVITAAILYYGSVDGVRPLADQIHFWAGVLFPLVVVGHVTLGRRQKQSLE